MMVLGKEWEDLFGNSMEITSFNDFSCESSNEYDIDIDYNNKERQTGTKILNTAVMGCYFLNSVLKSVVLLLWTEERLSQQMG